MEAFPVPAGTGCLFSDLKPYLEGKKKPHCYAAFQVLLNGGAGEDRTPDLLIANQALSQLSYNPMRFSRPMLPQNRLEWYGN